MSARFVEGSVRLNDGRGSVERVERDDAQGREAMDRWALRRIEDPNVAQVSVDHVDRFAGGRKGTYR